MLGPYLLGLRGPGRYVGDGGEGDPGFPEPPIVTDVNGDVTISGKVKPGSFGKFVYPLATIAASRQYTFRAVANFSQLAKQGKLAMVGFGLKSGNDFHLAGLRGDGSTGTNEYIVHGTPPNGWNKQTGHTEIDNGAAGAGTQHSAYYRLITSSDGTTYTLKTSTDGVSYTTVEAGRAPSPFTNISSVTTFGVALWFNNTDAGPFSVQITAFADEAAFVGTTWNPSDKSGNVTLSNGNLTAAAGTAGGSYSMVRAIAGKTSGKYYFEVVLTGAHTANENVGIANASASLTTYLGSSNNSIALNGDGTVMRNNGSVGTSGNPGNGDTIRVAVDRDNNTIFFAVNAGTWNNNVANDPATNTGGIAISAVTGTIYPAVNGYLLGDIFVANFGDLAFTYGVPSGFTAGWPA